MCVCVCVRVCANFKIEVTDEFCWFLSDNVEFFALQHAVRSSLCQTLYGWGVGAVYTNPYANWLKRALKNFEQTSLSDTLLYTLFYKLFDFSNNTIGIITFIVYDNNIKMAVDSGLYSNSICGRRKWYFRAKKRNYRCSNFTADYSYRVIYTIPYSFVFLTIDQFLFFLTFKIYSLLLTFFIINIESE